MTSRSGREHRLDDLVVAAAPAQVAAQPLLDLSLGGVRDPPQQVAGGHHLAGGAVAALGGTLLQEGPLQRGQGAVRGQPLDGDELGAVGFGGEHQAGVDDPAVQAHCAGTALPDQAAGLGAGQAQVVAKHAEQGLLRRCLEDAGAPIDRDLDAHSAGRAGHGRASLGVSSTPCSTPPSPLTCEGVPADAASSLCRSARLGGLKISISRHAVSCVHIPWGTQAGMIASWPSCRVRTSPSRSTSRSPSTTMAICSSAWTCIGASVFGANDTKFTIMRLLTTGLMPRPGRTSTGSMGATSTYRPASLGAAAARMVKYSSVSIIYAPVICGTVPQPGTAVPHQHHRRSSLVTASCRLRLRPVQKRPPDPLRGEGQVANHSSRRIADGRRDRGGNAEQRAFAHPLGAIGAGTIGVLDDVALQIQGQVHAGRDPVVDGPEVLDPSGLVEDVMLHEGVAQALDRRALVLPANLERVDRFPHVGDGDVARHDDFAGALVDLHLDGGAVELVERGAAAQNMAGLSLLAALPGAD